LLRKVAKMLWEAPLNLERFLIMGLGIVITGLMFAEVLVRYIVFSPQLWVEELIIYLVWWFYMAGGAYASYKRNYISCGMVHMLFPTKPKVLIGFRAVADAIGLVMSCIVIVLAYDQFTYSLQVNPRTIHLLLPLAYARLALLVGFVLITLYCLTQFIGSIRDLTRRLPATSSAGSGN